MSLVQVAEYTSRDEAIAAATAVQKARFPMSAEEDGTGRYVIIVSEEDAAAVLQLLSEAGRLPRTR